MCEHENPNASGWAATSRLIRVPLPTPDGPHTTRAAGGRVEAAEVWGGSDGVEAAAPMVCDDVGGGGRGGGTHGE